MGTTVRTIAIAAMTVALAACNRRGHSQESPPRTAAAPPATTAPSTATAATTDAAAISYIMIDHRVYAFPAARLRIRRPRQDGETVRAILFSNDPREAIQDDYHGNSFYLEMDLDTPDASQLASNPWIYRSPSSDRVESPTTGIFLDGTRQQIQPLDVRVDFDSGVATTQATAGASPGAAMPPAADQSQYVGVTLSGRWMRYQADKGPGQLVEVTADLIAKVELR